MKAQSKPPSRILCVEDNHADFRILVENLKDTGFNPMPDLVRVTTLRDAVARLEAAPHEFEVILLDLSLPDSLGADTYRAMGRVAPEATIVVLSGNDDQELALATVKAGAQDYLPKDSLTPDLLRRSVLYGLERQRWRTGMNKLYDRLRRTTQELQAAQMQIIQAEKLESLGRLAAGVAHEVKNPLGILQMGLDYLVNHSELESDVCRGVMQHMQVAIQRADSIICEMLSFSRAEEFHEQPLDVNELTQMALQMVNHDLVRRKVFVRTEYAQRLPQVMGDRSKLEQVLINLLLNAGQAMVEGGLIEVRTLLARLQETPPPEGSREVDRFWRGEEAVVIEIRDFGPGIPPEILGRIFDPFFTTKPTGEGTGLGLSVARRILDLHHGRLEITSMSKPCGARARIMLRTAPISSAAEILRPHVPETIATLLVSNTVPVAEFSEQP